MYRSEASVYTLYVAYDRGATSNGAEVCSVVA